MIHSQLGFIHTFAAVSAMVLGAFVFLGRKGTRIHKLIGYGYAICMAAMIVTAFCIYRLTGRFNFLHFFAIVSTLTLAGALVPVMIRRPQNSWLRLHYRLASWSYVGLLGAAAAEISIRLPKAPFWGAVFAGSAVVSVLGGCVIQWMQARTLAKFQRR